MVKEEPSSISREDWENLLFRYKAKSFLTDDFNTDYLVLHNESQESFKTKITKFKYSKLSLNHLLEKLKKNPKINPEFITWVEEYYKDKKSVTTYKIGMNQIIDNLLDVHLLINYVNERGIDWEFIPRADYERLFPPRKMKFQKNKRPKSLFEMSEASLKVEHHLIKRQMENALEKIEELITITKQKIDDRSK